MIVDPSMFRVGGVTLVVGVVVMFSLSFLGSETARADAQSIVETCKQEADSAACYEREISGLYPARLLREAFEVIREIRRSDISYQFCHVAAHKLGEEAVAEDPTKWIDLIPLNPPDGLCSNGFIHGIIVGRFRNDTLDIPTLEKTIPDFARACEPRSDWSPSSLDQAICYHGMGHLFMFITSADIRRSLDVCARITKSPTGNFERVCREGVFMQIYQPLEPDDFALIELLPEKPTQENYRRLCAAYKDNEDEGACLREAWPLFEKEIRKGAVAPFCVGQPDADEEFRCFESTLTIIGRGSLGNEAGASAVCMAVPERQRALCYTLVAQAFLEEDRTTGARALAFCARAEDTVAEACLSTLVSRARFIFGDTEERARFCEEVPEEHRSACAL